MERGNGAGTERLPRIACRGRRARRAMGDAPELGEPRAERLRSCRPQGVLEASQAVPEGSGVFMPGHPRPRLRLLATPVPA